MENRYPLFTGGRILKKEALWDLRDYTYDGLRLFYMDYTNGILRGCRVRAEGKQLIIGKGLLKYGDFIYIVQNKIVVPYEAENRLKVLKAKFHEEKDNPDYRTFGVSFFLDDNPERKENQIELCRFHLRTGSVLRDTYKNFFDMGTEYDTVNLIHSTVAGRGGERVHWEILLRFAEEMQSHEEKEDVDRLFCYEILCSAGEVETLLVMTYLKDKGAEIDVRNQDREKAFEQLVNILEKGSVRTYRSGNKNLIYVE